MPRYRLQVAYDGTDFSGWQRQAVPPDQLDALLARRAHDITPARSPIDVREPDRPPPALLPALAADQPPELRTVQAVLERALARVVRHPASVMGASRTDAGVHAIAQCAVFDARDDNEPRDDRPPEAEANAEPAAEEPAPRGVGWPAARGPDRLRLALNARLPPDVAILHADIVPETFNPILCARAKGYAYTLCVSPQRPVFARRFSHHVRDELNLCAMRHAAALLVGTHDFASFAAAGHGRASTVRTIFDCRVIELRDAATGEGRTIRIEVSGDGFLWNMVRIIAGTLVETGRGRIDEHRIRQALTTPDRRLAGPTLPPQGLRLEWIRYDPPLPSSARHERSSCQAERYLDVGESQRPSDGSVPSSSSPCPPRS